MTEAAHRVLTQPTEVLTAYLDGELSAAEAEEVEATLERSALWRRKLQELQAADTALLDWAAGASLEQLETVLAAPQENDDVSENVAEPVEGVESDDLDEEPPAVQVAPPARSDGPRWRRTLGVLAACAVAALLGVIISPTFQRVEAEVAAAPVVQAPEMTVSPDQPSAQFDDFVMSLIEDHDNFTRMQAPYELSSSDPRAVDEWLLRTRGVNTETPRWSANSLVGATRCQAQNTPTAITFLQDEAGLISVFAVERDELAQRLPQMTVPGFPGDCCNYTDDTALCMWTSDEWVFISVSNRTDTALRESLIASIDEENWGGQTSLSAETLYHK